MGFNPLSALAAKIYAGLFVGALSFAAVQTVRIEGLWFITGLEQKLVSARTALADEKTDRKADADAWRGQVLAAKAATIAAERKSQETAFNAQTFHDALAADNAGLRDYIAARRLRAGGNPAAATRTTDDLGAGIPATAAGRAIVAADEADLAACDANYIYAASAHGWARKLIAAGLATEATAP